MSNELNATQRAELVVGQHVWHTFFQCMSRVVRVEAGFEGLDGTWVDVELVGTDHPGIFGGTGCLRVPYDWELREFFTARAKALVENCCDYDDVEPGKCLGYYHDGVWLVDCSHTIDMAEMPKLLLVLPLVDREVTVPVSELCKGDRVVSGNDNPELFVVSRVVRGEGAYRNSVAVTMSQHDAGYDCSVWYDVSATMQVIRRGV